MTIDTAKMHRGATVATCPRKRPMFTLRINEHSHHSATSATPKKRKPIPTLSVHRDVLPTPTEPRLTNSDVISAANTSVTQFQNMLVVLIILGVERDNATQQRSQETKLNTPASLKWTTDRHTHQTILHIPRMWCCATTPLQRCNQ